MAAQLLSKDKDLARDSAKALLAHIAATRPENRTAFEVYLFEEDTLWKCIEEFSNAEPPVLLWKNNLKHETLFKFLAPRFLLAPDHVLDAERIHARWQWACSDKRRQTMQALNAELRL